MRLIWITDPHLEQADKITRDQFFRKIRNYRGDAGLVTGDVSSSEQLLEHLSYLARAFAPRPIYYVNGNHEYFGSSFAKTDYEINRICRLPDCINLYPLGHGEIIRLGKKAALIGHRGWADGRAGRGHHSKLAPRDFEAIADFRHLSHFERFCLMRELGEKSANYFYYLLRRAIHNYQTIWIATHVPPFNAAVRYNNRRCGNDYLPHFVNFAAGRTLLKIAHEFPGTNFRVLCGHTHQAVKVEILPNLLVESGEVIPRQPSIQRCIKI